MIEDNLYRQNIDSYTEDLNNHIFKVFQKGVAKLPKIGRYNFPDVITSEWYPVITKNSEFFRLLQYVFKVKINKLKGYISYSCPLGTKYDKAIIAISKYAEESDQILKVLAYAKEKQNEKQN